MPKWCDLNRDEVAAAARSGAVAVLPLGAIEQHGAHLPTGTDTLLAAAATTAAVARTGDIMLPALAYGCSLGHTAHWPGTLSLSVATLTAIVTDTGRWVATSGFRKLVVINAHATNGPAAQSALLTLRHEHPSLRTCFASLYDINAEAHKGYFSDADDPHANVAETSMVLHLDPDLVSLDRAVDEEDRTFSRVLTYPMPDVTHSGVVGRPTSATAAGGAALFTVIVDGITRLLEQVRAETEPIPDRAAELPSGDLHSPTKGPS
ncbi:creatininase family protein [Mycolicibacterium diernhoferi]|uniref:Creatininase n=1 Tax=Mycolicibacterium diernhoferi TaxID=1801 RepID=A0A1Q4HJ87_9MYCO|nr:creatininase family protein [Mycolicibacterium diernhoferi]OJZ67598.1 creatininase [Mycolicibacterium diernhoferi]OPE55399.1 creatininase [Mycolicibacterium diernhoferi]PEG55867.1 creatininase [Mycolicibacterium diernhoferi]QYL25249.1 creatininase family protein [Mycolicibacterium diernhoferi]